MIRYVLLLVPLLFLSSYGVVEEFDTDKDVYHDGDDLVITGRVAFNPDKPNVFIQILPPSKSTFIAIAQPLAGHDGKFSAAFTVGGKLWTVDGSYPVIVSYDGHKIEEAVQYMEYAPDPPRGDPGGPPQDEPDPPVNDPKPAVPRPAPTAPEGGIDVDEIKSRIPDFPAPDRSPQYYIDRYDSEPDYKSWFDSQFPGHTVREVVGYKPTGIDGFPAQDKPPAHYIGRYDSEPDYKSWFDSQFPGRTIHEILGQPAPVSVPGWVADDARSWAVGGLPDSEFLTGIKFMIKNKIVVPPTIPASDAPESAPDWLRNSVQWWSEGLITDEEFVALLEFLVSGGHIILS